MPLGRQYFLNPYPGLLKLPPRFPLDAPKKEGLDGVALEKPGPRALGVSPAPALVIEPTPT